MLGIRAHLLHSIYDWLLGVDLIPYLLVDADYDGVVVPGEYIEDGTIVLNLSDDAVEDLVIDDEGVSFVATFSGEPWHIVVPLNAILALYDHEFAQGVYASDDDSGWFINEGEFDEPPEGGDDKPSKPAKGGKPNLRVVK
jgi:stringent starvation protein B